MFRQRVIVQASSRSWSGGRDLCMTEIDGHPVIYWTIKRMLDCLSNVDIVVASPTFDHGGELEFFSKAFYSEPVSIFYGHDTSPLNRMIDICKDLKDEDHIIRVDGLHFCVDTDASLNMLKMAKADSLDCVKLPDDFPVQFTSDIYRVGALRKLDKLLVNEAEAIYKVHPKFYMFIRKDIFRCAYLKGLASYSDAFLIECRQQAQPIYSVPRTEVNEHRISSGDQDTFHYKLALKYLLPDMKLLDIACGYGYGTQMIAQKVASAHGADIDINVIAKAKACNKTPNMFFHIEDTTHMTFSSAEFDAIVSMETIEHVDAQPYLREVYRVLKPRGLLLISTPQNRMGHIPIHSGHWREYSLEEIVDLCSQYFVVDTIIGIKAGCIIVPNDPYGTNTMLVCTKQGGKRK